MCYRDGDLPLSTDLHTVTTAVAICPDPKAAGSTPGQRVSKPMSNTCWTRPKPGASAARVEPETPHF